MEVLQRANPCRISVLCLLFGLVGCSSTDQLSCCNVTLGDPVQSAVAQAPEEASAETNYQIEVAASGSNSQIEGQLLDNTRKAPETGSEIEQTSFPSSSETEDQWLENTGQSSATDPYPIDLSAALRLAEAQNPLVAFAREQIIEALARQQAAEVLWLPSLHGGVSWNKHDGTLQVATGPVLEISRAALNAGAGVGAAGTGSPPVPGVFAAFHLADAIFQPLAACQFTRSRQAASAAVRNDVLLDVALAYLELLRALQDVTIAEEARHNAQQLADLTDTHARAGEGLQADADRAHVELAIRENDLEQARESLQVASARLAELLRLDPTVKLQPIEPSVAPIELVAEDELLSELVAQALENRPELAESRHLVSEAVELLKREQFAPLIPSLALGVSYGSFGGGEGDGLEDFDDRWDLDLMAFWELRNLGFGDHAALRATRSRLQQARLRQVAVMDRVAREVTEAQAQVQARRQQIGTAEQGVKAALSSYERNLERIRDRLGLPIEVLQSIQALAQARREYLRAVIDYNNAQFTLHRSLGWAVKSPDSPDGNSSYDSSN